MKKLKIGPWRAALNWYFCILIFGSIAATAFPTLPFFLVIILLYGVPPPEPAWEVLRILQIIQGFIISYTGGYLTLLYFNKKYEISYKEMKSPMKILAISVPTSSVFIILFISLPKYGMTKILLITALLIFGTFTILFLLGSFHFAKKLEYTDPNSD